MDRAVLDIYGWTDIQSKCEFISEFDDNDEEDEGGRQRKKKYRYRWPDEIRDEVLARLLESNRQRALQEGQVPSGSAVPAQIHARKATRKARAKVAEVPDQISMELGKA